MLRKLTFILLLLGLMSATSGCAINRATASLMGGADLSSIKTFYVVPGQEDKETAELIKANLTKRGYAVTTGPEMKPPYPADAVATYASKWMWDLTMYMLELTIEFKDPTNDFPMATGNSYHTSVTRKSPEEMVDEVLTNIFRAK
jgi:hypothetical protein